MASSRDDFIIAIRSAFLKKSTQQKFSLLTLIFVSIFIILLSGMTLPLFALNLALVNDYIPKEKFVAAGAGLNMIFGLGAIAGPIVCSVLMSIFGPNGFFIHLLIFFMVIIIFGVFRMNRRKYEDNPESTFTPLPKDITPLGIELDPDTGVDLSNTSNDKK